MNSSLALVEIEWSRDIWQAAEKLVSPLNDEREHALESLIDKGVPRKSPLIAYLLVSMISDPVLETRFHCVQALGSILVKDSQDEYCSDQVLYYLQAYLARINRDQMLDLLAVADQYLSAEQNLIELFKLCSYAGSILNGIVNDRKIPVSIRQKAIYFSGELGFLDTIITLRGLVNRIEKRDQCKAGQRKRSRDENELYPYAVAALDKLILKTSSEGINLWQEK
jgi:hypothetical protein